MFGDDRVWQVPQEQFVAAWNGARTVDAAAARVKELAGNGPRSAVMARAMKLRREGIRMKPLTAARVWPTEAIKGGPR